MNHIRLALAGALALPLAVCHAATIYVNGTTGNNSWSGLCETWDGGTCGPKRTIAAGLVAGSYPDIVLVAPGTYSGPGNTDLDVYRSLKSQSGPETCIIDCEHQSAAVRIGGGSMIEGFTIRRARAVQNPRRGGAISVAGSGPAVVRNCVIRECTGGGWPPAAGSAVLCEVDNVDILIDASTITECSGPFIIQGPNGSTGVTFTNCHVTNNVPWQDSTFGSVLVRNGATFRDCNITDNQGSIYANVSDSVVSRNFLPARPQPYGNPGLTLLSGSVFHSIIAYNQGWGGGVTSGPIQHSLVIGNIMLSNNGGAPTPAVTYGQVRNSIVWGNYGPQIAVNNESIVVQFSCIEGGYPWGQGNIGVDPRFVDPVGPDLNPATIGDNDYHLLPTSPCINRGDPAVVGAGLVDWDGEPRVMRGRLDIGMDEFTGDPFAFGDANCDGIRDFFDIDAFVAALSGEAAYYGEFPDCFRQSADCDDDGEIDFFDIDAFVGLLGG